MSEPINHSIYGNSTMDDPRFDASREIRAPRGNLRVCKSWLTEAAYRMLQNNLDPDVAEMAPSATTLTAYDQEHLVTYLRLLDADADGADWREVARIVLHIDPDSEPDRARHAFDSHLSRAKWMTAHGYRHLLRGDSSS